MLFSPANKNGYAILKKCFKTFYTFPTAMALSLLIVVINSLIFGGILYAEEYYYGISIFNSFTFYNLLSFEIKTHLFKVAIFLFILLIATFINNIFKVALAFYYTKKLSNQKHSFFSVLAWSFTKIPFLLHIALILVAEYVSCFFYLLSLRELFVNLLLDIQGKKRAQYNAMNANEGMLLLPLIVSNKKSIPENLNESENIMKKTFGDSFYYNVSFADIKLGTALFIIGTFGIFTHYHYNLLPAIVLSFFLLLLTFVILENTLLFFKVCMYHYTQKKNSSPFTKQEINSYFIQTD